jgi:hypothetical protein
MDGFTCFHFEYPLLSTRLFSAATCCRKQALRIARFFLDTKYQNWGNIPNDQKMYKIVTKKVKDRKVQIFHAKAFPTTQNLGEWLL